MLHNRRMNGLLRLTTILATAFVAASLTGACGGDDSEPVPGIEAGGTTGKNDSGAKSDASGGSANGPESAGDRNPDAPDNGISDRPGGPNQSGGSGQAGGNGASGGSGSGGVSPPLPSPVR
jgi:hypothetical protein